MNDTPSSATANSTAATPVDAALPSPTLHSFTMEELENTVRNGKKKLYWSAYEVVLTTSLPSGEQRETRYDAYQVNHNHLKKIHNGARGASYVRVECKYCTNPQFTQSITVSTKKFEEHFMTLHATDGLASANRKKAEQIKNMKMENKNKMKNKNKNQQQQHRSSALAAIPQNAIAAEENSSSGDEENEDGHGGDEEEDDGEEEMTEDDTQVPRDSGGPPLKRGRSPTTNGGPAAKRRRHRGSTNKEDDDHVAAMAGAAAAVFALSGGGGGGSTTPTRKADKFFSQSAQSSSAVDDTTTSNMPLDPAESDTKRAKKQYWTAYEVVISQRSSSSSTTTGDSSSSVIQETRQDAWRVNHNALRRLHLDPTNDTIVRVECRFCVEPKFNQSITVSTRKFEHHYFFEHGTPRERHDAEELMVKQAADVALKKAMAVNDRHAGGGGGGGGGARGGAATTTKQAADGRRRKSWKALLVDQETSSNIATAAAAVAASRGLVAGSASAGGRSAAATLRHAQAQRGVLLDWLLHDCRPLSTVESASFQLFTSSLDKKFDTSSALLPAMATQLTDRYETTKQQLKTIFKDQVAQGTTFTLTVDDFTSRHDNHTKNYLCISVHFVSSTWQRHEFLIACRPVKRTTATNMTYQDVMRDIMSRVLEEDYEIPLSAVFAVATRHEETIGEAVKSLLLTKKGKKTAKPVVVVVHCAADALQAVAQAGVDALRSSEASGGVEELHSDWRSAYSWLKSAQDKKAPPDAAAVAAATAGGDGGQDDQKTVAQEAALSLLEPFARVAEDMSRASSYPSIPMVFQYFRHLQESLSATSSGDIVKVIATPMATTLSNLYDRVVSLDALVAYVLDPRFRFTHISHANEKKIRVMIEAAIARSSSSDPSEQEDDQEEGAETQDAEGMETCDVGEAASLRPPRSLFEELVTSGKRTSLGGSSSTITTSAAGTVGSATSATSTLSATSMAVAASAEFQEYLALDDEDFGVDVLAWWQSHEPTFPTLARVARQYLALVGTCRPAQEAFTSPGQELVVKRSLLDPQTMEAMLVTRAAGDALRQAVASTKPQQEQPSQATVAATSTTVAATSSTSSSSAPPASSSSPSNGSAASAPSVAASESTLANKACLV